MLYARLGLFKSIAARLASEEPSARRPNPVAGIIGLSSQADYTSIGDQGANAEHFYELLLESCERLFDNEIEQIGFEDQMRLMFGTKVSPGFRVIVMT